MLPTADKAELLARIAALRTYADGLAPDAAAPPPPPPAPPPPAVTDKYRYQHPYLFQTARAKQEASRLPEGFPLDNETHGPTRSLIDSRAGWKWDNLGGDWVDSAQVSQGSSPWFTVLTNAVSGGTAIAPYSVSVTSALQFIQTNDRWNAMLLRCPNAPRSLATKFHGTQSPPRIEVTYVGGATATLACRIVAFNSGSTQIPKTTTAEIQLPVFVEFDKPTAVVQSATLHFTITQHWSGATPNVEGLVLDPSVNADPVVQGVASTQPLDAGLVGHASIINVHRYLDGTAFEDFVRPGTINIDAESNFDPAIYGTGPTDLTKLPHLGLGKWVNPLPGWSLVDSAHAQDGFVPLAPGMGAIKVSMPKVSTGDGFVGGYTGTLAAHTKLYLPEPLFGNLDHIFVRHYVRIGSPNGAPYSMPIADRYQVYKAVGQAAWSDCGGKFGVMPAHDTTGGGVSGTSGGGFGWQMRLGWTDCTTDDLGPDTGGWSGIIHTYDFQINNPVGHRYGSSDSAYDYGLGQRGGMNMLYADRWYCIEAEMKLNTVMVGAPGYVADGELRVWVDGRLSLQRTGMVFRSLPINAGPYDPGHLRPCRTLGVKDIWLNWFHGGLTKNTVDRTMFVTGVAYGTAYIGPMKLGV